MRPARRRPATTLAILAAAGAAVLGAALLTARVHRGEEPVPVADPTAHVPEPVSIPEPREPDPLAEPPRIDVVFALDTTGSMAGMIEGAKQKIWSLANEIVAGQPRPIVRFGLVAYRDKGDEYVTRVTPLTDDMDLIYEKLMGFRAGGGGDRPEHVNRALLDALEMDWEQGDNALRLVFLVGDAPPHEHYTDTPTSAELARRASQQGILINTIRCGQAEDTERAWTAIAQLSGGEFATIEQSGGVIAVATPYDEELERLNRELAATGIGWGSRDARDALKRRIEARMSMRSEVAAAAASYSAKGAGAAPLGKGDLLADMEGGYVDLEELDPAELPDELQVLAPEERRAHIEDARAKRAEVQARIRAVASDRDAWLKDHTPSDDGLDRKVMGAVRSQAAKLKMSW